MAYETGDPTSLVARMLVGKCERIVGLAIARAELPLELARPEIVWLDRGGRATSGWASPIESRERPASSFLLEYSPDGELGR